MGRRRRLPDNVVQKLRVELAQRAELRDELRHYTYRAIGERYGLLPQTVHMVDQGVIYRDARCGD